MRGLLHHGHPVLDGMPDLLREVGGRQLWWNCDEELTKISSSVYSGRSAMLAHTGLLSSSLSLMAQGFGVTIGAETEIMARPVSMTMLAFLATTW